MIFLLFVFGSIAFYKFCKKKNISLDGYIYIKNKRIIPFFKTVIFGPMSIHVDDTRVVKKAEFYIDGKLAETIATPPYLWELGERGFSKHTLETKIYDRDGESASSGQLSFYNFNPF